MGRAIRWIGLTALALVVFGSAWPAGAVSLWSGGVGGSVTANGVTISVASCSLKLGGSNQSSCSVLNAEMVVVTGTDAQIKIGGNGGTDLFSTANIVGTANERNGLNDMNVTLDVTYAAGLINYVGATLTGAVTGTATNAIKTKELAYVSLSETFSGVVGATNIVGLSLAALPANTFSGTVSANSGTFTGVHTLQVTKDIRLDPTGLKGVDSLSLSNVTQTFKKVPEPAAIAILLVGLGGLAVARRRRR